jgi:hypothetical protein
MDDNVIKLVPPGPVGDGYHIEADQILEAAKGEFNQLVIVGHGKDGTVSIRMTDGIADSVVMLAFAQTQLVQGSYEDS